MKGDRKRRKNLNFGFKKGNTHYIKAHQATSNAAGASSSASNIQGSPETETAQPLAEGQENISRTPILRPRPEPCQELKNEETSYEFEGNRIVDITLVLEMFNDAAKCHFDQAKHCNFPVWEYSGQRKWGFGWQKRLLCTVCNFQTNYYKLYTEIPTFNKPGPNPASINWNFQLALQNTSMGNRRSREMVAALDIPPPNRSSMQRASNQVNTATLALNKKDMGEKRQLVKAINQVKGQEHPEELDIAIDGRYNSITFGSSKKPGYNASQAYAIACETNTDKQYIIGAAMQNKLCWTGTWLRGNGYDVHCPGGHEDCTANIEMFSPLSEYEMAKSIGEDLAADGFKVKHATTDGDARSAQGFQDAMRIFHPDWQVTRLADPTHVSRAQFRQCRSAHFSPEMFPCKTRRRLDDMRKVFAQDVKARCSLVYKKLMDTYTGDINIICSKLPLVVESTILCYSGDCSKCRRNSVVCEGGDRHNWWNQSYILAPNKLTSLHLNENDKHLLKVILEMRLSQSAIEEMKLNTSTQKCEGLNRAVSEVLPKHTNYSRNAEGILSAEILRQNNSPGLATSMKAAKITLPLSGHTRQYLKSIDQEYAYRREYRKRKAVKRREMQRKATLIKQHAAARKGKTKPGCTYNKGQLDPKPTSLKSKGSNPEDHTYYQT